MIRFAMKARRGWEKAVPGLQADRVGKLSPGARQFVILLLSKLAAALEKAATQLERKGAVEPLHEDVTDDDDAECA